MEIEIYDYEEIELFDEEFKEKIRGEVEKVIREKDIFSVQKWLKEQPYSDNLEANFSVMDFSVNEITHGEIYISVTKKCVEIKLVSWTEDTAGYHEETIGVVRW